MVRIAIRFVTVAALAGALGFAAWWCVQPQKDWLQAPSTALALIAALSGIPAERWAAETQRRDRALASLRQELAQNRAILADPRFRPERQGIGQVYPRLMLGAVDTAFISGAFTSSQDKELIRQLLVWRNLAQDLNRRLDITELRLCTVDGIHADELAALRSMMHRPGGYFVAVAEQIDALESILNDAGERLRWTWSYVWRTVRRREPEARPAPGAVLSGTALTVVEPD
jgi:hypothetical protein